MATIQPLKEDQNRSILLVTGTGAETNTVVVNGAALAGAINGATGPLAFYDYQVEAINWSFPSGSPGYLAWQGATGFFVMNNSGQIRLKRDFSATAFNFVQNQYYGATGVVGTQATYYPSNTTWGGATGFAKGSGNVVLNYAGTAGYSFVVSLLKNTDTYNRYFSVEPVTPTNPGIAGTA